MLYVVHDGTKPVKAAQPQDPSADLIYTMLLRPDEWRPNTMYHKERSVVIPMDGFNGYYYVAMKSGMSDTIPPAFMCEEDAIVKDDCIDWLTKSYNFYLNDKVNIVSAEWSADDDRVVISNIIEEKNKTQANISSLPDDLAQVTITVKFRFDNGEEDSRSFIIKIKEL